MENQEITFFKGTHRIISPSKTIKNNESKIKTAGITRITEITHLDRIGIPVFSAIRPTAQDGGISIYGGKGITPEHAYQYGKGQLESGSEAGQGTGSRGVPRRGRDRGQGLSELPYLRQGQGDRQGEHDHRCQGRHGRGRVRSAGQRQERHLRQAQLP